MRTIIALYLSALLSVPMSVWVWNNAAASGTATLDALAIVALCVFGITLVVAYALQIWKDFE